MSDALGCAGPLTGVCSLSSSSPPYHQHLLGWCCQAAWSTGGKAPANTHKFRTDTDTAPYPNSNTPVIIFCPTSKQTNDLILSVIHLIETGLPLCCIERLQIVDQQSPLEVGEGLHTNLPPGIAAQPSNTWSGQQWKRRPLWTGSGWASCWTLKL